ncbi:hydantoinase/oxoprolinase N-terminal domain-containing protein, partial [Lacticaseibacillus paracasei]
MKYRLGIDVGGTNTDAVILDEQQTVVASIKTHTTADIEAGI